MSATHASTEAMDRMIKNLNKFEQSQNALMAALRRDYAAVGSEWHDEKYNQLGDAIGQAITSISNSSVQISEVSTKVGLLKDKLEEYLAQQI